MRLWLAALAAVLLLTPVGAHELHEGPQQHVNYSNWKNNADRGCCNDHDCRPISDADVVMSTKTEVRVEGEWCPVLPQHYLKTGNAPDWSSAHVCVQKTFINGVEIKPPGSPCRRLLCFQPKPLF
jgi:hypothetical protein